MTAVYAANLGSAPYVDADRNLAVSFYYVAAFNTPASSWNTIVIPKVVGGNAGDVIKLSVYKGTIPDDPTTDDDNSEPSRLDVNDLLDSATYTVASNIGTSGISVQLNFDTTFSFANCGAAYTVLAEQFDSSGNHANFSAVFCTDRDGVYNYINSVDKGVEGIGFNGYGGGGVGNVYKQFRYGAGISDVHTSSLEVATANIDGTLVYDPCPAWGIYSREVVTLNSTAYGTTRSLTAPLTNSLTASLT